MRAVGLKILKNKLSEYIRLVRTGETVLITDRNQVVAEIVPPQLRSSNLNDVVLVELARKGILTPKLETSGEPPRQPHLKFAKLMSGLNEDRED